MHHYPLQVLLYSLLGIYKEEKNYIIVSLVYHLEKVLL
jgi:hypothetical protein